MPQLVARGLTIDIDRPMIMAFSDRMGVKNITLLYKRYGVATESGTLQQGWNTQVRLFPSARVPYGWDEQITTGPALRDVMDAVPVVLVDSYTFPVHNRLAGKNPNSKTT